VKLVLAAFGRMRSRELGSAAGEYHRRLRKYAALEHLELREEKGDSRGSRDREADRLISSLREGDFLVLCDERGRQMCSAELADFLAERERSGRGRTIFLVGGPYGVGEAVRARADAALSLSRLTLPHELARLVLTEALYRAFSILRGEKYHHG
jgi:23S rRNA (pseudouridine1915-N3)-methyltransferase